MSFTLSDYLTRIGWPIDQNGEFENISKTRENLILLQRHHSTAIPFDNFDFHTGVPIEIESDAVWENKVRDGKRGTYCFQGNALFNKVLQMIGFVSTLIPVLSYSPFAKAFLATHPTHCCVIVEFEDEDKKSWALVDVATVDCIDGVIDLSVPCETVQVTKNGIKYKFNYILNDSGFPLSDAFINDATERGFQDYVNSELTPKCGTLSLVLCKEDVRRDQDLNPITPLQFDWIPRFKFILHLKESNISLRNISEDSVSSLTNLPESLPIPVAELLVEYTVFRDIKSHHYKQWVGVKYSRDGRKKTIVSGFRFIEVERPFSDRRVVRCSNESGLSVCNTGEQQPLELIVQDWNQMKKHLEEEIGISLSDDCLQSLNIVHNHTTLAVEFVWPY